MTDGPLTFPVYFWAGPWDGLTVGPPASNAPTGAPVSFLESASPGNTGVYVMAATATGKRAEWHPGTMLWRDEL